MASREETLIDLLELRRPISQVASELSAFAWDCDEELVRLTKANVANVLHKFLDGELSREEVIEWASQIECREDIDYEGFSDLIFQLSTPEINGQLDRSSAAEIIDSIGA